MQLKNIFLHIYVAVIANFVKKKKICDKSDNKTVCRIRTEQYT